MSIIRSIFKYLSIVLFIVSLTLLPFPRKDDYSLEKNLSQTPHGKWNVCFHGMFLVFKYTQCVACWMSFQSCIQVWCIQYYDVKNGLSQNMMQNEKQFREKKKGKQELFDEDYCFRQEREETHKRVLCMHDEIEKKKRRHIRHSTEVTVLPRSTA